MTKQHLIVKVTDRDIRDGIPSDPEHCALALAIRSATDPLAFVSVGHFIATVNRQFYKLSQDAEQFVSDFDASEGAQDIPPATFKLTTISDKYGYRLLSKGEN